MALGYRGHPAWRDMSEYAVHFTKATDTASAYDTMLAILGQRCLRPGGRFGAARSRDGLGSSQESVCFSEIPLDQLGRLVERRSKYGIGFTQEYLLTQGGARVWYVDKDTRLAGAISEAIDAASGPPLQKLDPIWKLTPFIDLPGSYGSAGYRFEWEREWRIVGEVRFDVSDVAFLFIPSELHGAARHFFREARDSNLGPSYMCAYLDPLWPDDRIQAALAAM